MRVKNIFHGLVILLVAGCVTAQPESKSRPSLTASSHDRQAYPQTLRTPILSYLGVAFWAQATFENDIVAFGGLFDDGVQKEMLSFYGRHPEPSWEALGTAVDSLAGRMARVEDDALVVLISSHGTVGSVAWNSGRDSGLISGADISELLKPLAEERLLVIISACFSGSLIEDIQSPNRIIIAAAAADRTSFGCQPSSRNSYFVESLLAEIRGGARTAADMFRRAKAHVRRLEAKRVREGQFSNPQIFIGENMAVFAERVLLR